jgi:hypothetical protein
MFEKVTTMGTPTNHFLEPHTLQDTTKAPGSPPGPKACLLASDRPGWGVPSGTG